MTSVTINAIMIKSRLKRFFFFWSHAENPKLAYLRVSRPQLVVSNRRNYDKHSEVLIV